MSPGILAAGRAAAVEIQQITAPQITLKITRGRRPVDVDYTDDTSEVNPSSSFRELSMEEEETYSEKSSSDDSSTSDDSISLGSRAGNNRVAGSDESGDEDELDGHDRKDEHTNEKPILPYSYFDDDDDTDIHGSRAENNRYISDILSYN